MPFFFPCRPARGLLLAAGLASAMAAFGQRPHTAPVIPTRVQPPAGDTLPIDTAARPRPAPPATAPRPAPTPAPARDTARVDSVPADTAPRIRPPAFDPTRDVGRRADTLEPVFGWVSPYAV